MTDPAKAGAEVMATLVADLSEDFDTECQNRHDMGQKKYGPAKFLEVNSIQMAIEEIVDFANYARYTYIKLRLIEMYVAGEFGGEELKEGLDKAKGFQQPNGFQKS